MVTNETTLNAARASIRHDAQSTDSATCVISEVESVGTFDLGSIFQSLFDSLSLVVYVATHLRGLAVRLRGC